MPRRRKSPTIPEKENVWVGPSFRRLSKYKKYYILKNPDGKPVSLAVAAANYQKDDDPKWPLHVMFSNFGYVAVCVSRTLAGYRVNPDEYIYTAFEGICKALKKCDPERVKMSYIATSIFYEVRKEADGYMRKMKGEAEITAVDADGDLLDDDKLAALFGIFLNDYE